MSSKHLITAITTYLFTRLQQTTKYFMSKLYIKYFVYKLQVLHYTQQLLQQVISLYYIYCRLLLFRLITVFTSFTLAANLNDWILSRKHSMKGDTLTIMRVFELPPRLDCKRYVSLEFL